MLRWFSNWNLFYIALASLILLIYEAFYFKKIPNKHIKLLYYFITISTASYCIATLLMYNSILLFAPKLIVNDKHSLQSKIEHIIVPILFNVYFIISSKKYINKKFKYKDIFLKIILPSFIYPLIYISYCMIMGYRTNFYPYFIFDINQIGILEYLMYLLLIIFINLTIVFIYCLPFIIKIHLYKKKNNYDNGYIKKELTK